MTTSPDAHGSAPTAVGEDDVIDVLPSRGGDGLGFLFKVRATGRVYRLDAARDPDEPRYWCLRITRRQPAGHPDLTERPWSGGDRLTREEIPALIAAIRDAPAAWLALPQALALRRWILEGASGDQPGPDAQGAADATSVARLTARQPLERTQRGLT